MATPRWEYKAYWGLRSGAVLVVLIDAVCVISNTCATVLYWKDAVDHWNSHSRVVNKENYEKPTNLATTYLHHFNIMQRCCLTPVSVVVMFAATYSVAWGVLLVVMLLVDIIVLFLLCVGIQKNWAQDIQPWLVANVVFIGISLFLNFMNFLILVMNHMWIDWLSGLVANIVRIAMWVVVHAYSKELLVYNQSINERSSINKTISPDRDMHPIKFMWQMQKQEGAEESDYILPNDGSESLK